MDLIEVLVDKFIYRNVFNIIVMSFFFEEIVDFIKKYIFDFVIEYDVDFVR